MLKLLRGTTILNWLNHILYQECYIKVSRGVPPLKTKFVYRTINNQSVVSHLKLFRGKTIYIVLHGFFLFVCLFVCFVFCFVLFFGFWFFGVLGVFFYFILFLKICNPFQNYH